MLNWLKCASLEWNQDGGSKKKFTTMDVYHAVRGMELLYANAKNVPNNSMVIILYAYDQWALCS